MKVTNHEQDLVQSLEIFDRINVSCQQFVDGTKDARESEYIL